MNIDYETYRLGSIFFFPFRNNCKSQAEKNMQMFSPNNQKKFC